MLGSIDAYLLAQLGITLPKVAEKQTTFFVCSEKVSGGRYDPFYYNRFLIDAENAMQNAKYSFVKLKNVAIQLKTGTTTASKLQPFADEGIVFLRNSDLQPYKIDLSNVKYVKPSLQKELTFSEKNEIIICTAGTVGTCAVNEFDEPIAINQNITSIVLREDIINPYFLSVYLNSKLAIAFTKRVCSMATIFYLNNENLKIYLYPYHHLKYKMK